MASRGEQPARSRLRHLPQRTDPSGRRAGGLGAGPRPRAADPSGRQPRAGAVGLPRRFGRGCRPRPRHRPVTARPRPAAAAARSAAPDPGGGLDPVGDPDVPVLRGLDGLHHLHGRAVPDPAQHRARGGIGASPACRRRPQPRRGRCRDPARGDPAGRRAQHRDGGGDRDGHGVVLPRDCRDDLRPVRDRLLHLGILYAAELRRHRRRHAVDRPPRDGIEPRRPLARRPGDALGRRGGQR
ncbi:hypothetical protein MSPGM_33130 [Methylorubrum sp. GM97]|nr:hypothetical protein MSPGM_33130 [Methylorubrum sp. GM97]